jgi:site-specific DNA-methyltransferase (adenine-specific)
MENRIPDNSIKLILTSPPYDNLRKYNNNYFFDFERIAKLLSTKLVKGGVIVWVIGDATIRGSETGTSFRQALYFKDECKLNLHDTMIFEKNTTSFPARRKGNRYSQIFEYMFVFSKGVPKANLICDKENRWKGYVNFGKNTYRDKNDSLFVREDIKPVPDFSPRNNIWKYIVTKLPGIGVENSNDHPAIFPEKLAEDHILTWTNEGDIVYDPFAGSGTTLKMAMKLNRRFIGSEINPEYEYIIKKRLEK